MKDVKSYGAINDENSKSLTLDVSDHCIHSKKDKEDQLPANDIESNDENKALLSKNKNEIVNNSKKDGENSIKDDANSSLVVSFLLMVFFLMPQVLV